jgi:anti-sigma regulatory factor (Ser/Thr protein kinase)
MPGKQPRPERRADEMMLAVSKIATNAVLHAGSNVSVGLARHKDVVCLVVGDTSTDPPVPRGL